MIKNRKERIVDLIQIKKMFARGFARWRVDDMYIIGSKAIFITSDKVIFPDMSIYDITQIECGDLKIFGGMRLLAEVSRYYGLEFKEALSDPEDALDKLIRGEFELLIESDEQQIKAREQSNKPIATIIDFVTEHAVIADKEVLMKYSCPNVYDHDFGYKWRKPAYCNGGRPRNGEDVCKKCWGRPVGEPAKN